MDMTQDFKKGEKSEMALIPKQLEGWSFHLLILEVWEEQVERRVAKIQWFDFEHAKFEEPSVL